MFQKALLAFIFTGISSIGYAQWATWESPIAEIVYNNCTVCHRSDGIAPFALESYADALANNLYMQTAVNDGHMPPWPPNKDYRRFAHERSLTSAEIDAINDWVNHGAPSGDLALAPAPPVFSSIWEIPSPDLSLRMPTYASSAVSSDEYRCFVMPSGLSVDKFISELEVVPGNRQAVHHVLVFQDPSGDCAALDAASPEPGYLSFGDAGSDNAELIGLWAPGGNKFLLPAGTGLKVNANADIVIQVHYPAGSAGLVDSTRVNFKYATGSFVREIFLDPLLYHWAPCIDAPLIIAADSIKTFVETTNSSDLAPVKGSLLAVAPHMHLIGTSIKSFAVEADGDTIPLIDIPKWNFHWQGMYFFQYVQPLELNTDLKAVAVFNNTSANPFNPSSPPQLVHLGEATTDEMMLVYFLYTYYLPGDEDILQDSSLLLSPIPVSYDGYSHMRLYPNPADDYCLLEMPVDDVIGKIEIFDLDGRIIIQGTPASEHFTRVNTSDLRSGVYLVRMQGEKKIYSGRMLIR